MNYTLPNGTVDTLGQLFVYANTQSGSILGNLMLVAVFLIVMFRKMDVDGFKKRITYASFVATILGLFLFTIGVVNAFVFGIFLVASILTILWITFTGI